MPRPVPESDVLLVVMGAPHASELVTTVFRLLPAMLEHGGRVQVWTCGYATALTQRTLGPVKARNVHDFRTEHPTTAALVRALLARYPDRLWWYCCLFCSEDRGCTAQVDEVVVRSPSRFPLHVAAAGKTIFLGVQ